MKRKIYFTALALLISMVSDVNGMYWPYNGVGGDDFEKLVVHRGVAQYLNGFDAPGASAEPQQKRRRLADPAQTASGASANAGLYNVQTLYAAVPAMVHQEMPAQVPVASNAQPALSAGSANSSYYGDLFAPAMGPQSMQYTGASANAGLYNMQTLYAAVPAMEHQEMPAQVPVASSAQPALIIAPPPAASSNEDLRRQVDASSLTEQEIIKQIDTGERPLLLKENTVYVPRFMPLEVLKRLFSLRKGITIINVVYNNSIVHVLNVSNYVSDGKCKSPVLIPWVNKEHNRCNLFDILSSHEIVAQYFRRFVRYSKLSRHIKHSTDILDKFLLAECPFVADNLNEIQERVSADGKSLFIPYLLNAQNASALFDKVGQKVHEVYLHILGSKLCLYIKEGSNLGFTHGEQMKTFTLFVQNVEVVPALLLSLQLYRIVNSRNNEDRRICRKNLSRTLDGLFPEIADAQPASSTSAPEER